MYLLYPNVKISLMIPKSNILIYMTKVYKDFKSAKNHSRLDHG